jgi:hypothetical protein
MSAWCDPGRAEHGPLAGIAWIVAMPPRGWLTGGAMPLEVVLPAGPCAGR